MSVPTLWTVFVVNFLAVGLIWAYVLRSYPAFEAARFWTARRSWAPGCCAGNAALRCGFTGAAAVRWHVLIFAACLAAMGIRRF